MIFISGSGLCVFFLLRGEVTCRAYFIGGAKKGREGKLAKSQSRRDLIALITKSLGTERKKMRRRFSHPFPPPSCADAKGENERTEKPKKRSFLSFLPPLFWQIRYAYLFFPLFCPAPFFQLCYSFLFSLAFFSYFGIWETGYPRSPPPPPPRLRRRRESLVDNGGWGGVLFASVPFPQKSV